MGGYRSIFIYVHVYIYICPYMFIYVHICSFMFIYVHICSYMFIYVHLCSFMFIYVHICSYICSFLFIYVHVCSLYVYVHICSFMFIYVHICSYMFIYVLFICFLKCPRTRIPNSGMTRGSIWPHRPCWSWQYLLGVPQTHPRRRNLAFLNVADSSCFPGFRQNTFEHYWALSVILINIK